MTQTDTELQMAVPFDGAWLVLLRRYMIFTAIAHLLWEIAHLPLYTIWTQGDVGELAFAVVHCTGGDLLITIAALMLALLLGGHARWPWQSYERVAALAVVFGVSYTVFSEWLNTVVRESWAYSALMPVIPVGDIGLSPVAQWLVIPLVGLLWARRGIDRRHRSDVSDATPINGTAV